MYLWFVQVTKWNFQNLAGRARNNIQQINHFQDILALCLDKITFDWANCRIIYKRNSNLTTRVIISQE